MFVFFWISSANVKICFSHTHLKIVSAVDQNYWFCGSRLHSPTPIMLMLDHFSSSLLLLIIELHVSLYEVL